MRFLDIILFIGFGIMCFGMISPTLLGLVNDNIYEFWGFYVMLVGDVIFFGSLIIILKKSNLFLKYNSEGKITK